MTRSIYVGTCLIPRHVTWREPKINFLRSLDAARKTQRGLANCDGPCPRFVAMASARRLARPIFYPVGSKSTQLPSLADFITRRDRISRSHASANISVQTSRYFVIPTPDIRSLGVAQPLLITSNAVVPQTQRFRRGLPQTNDVQKGIFYVLGPSPRIRVARFKVRGSA
jgi:hypothetical protein